MMHNFRKWIVPLLFLGALALAATPSDAAISGTSHDVGTGVYQSCSTCHIPHGGKGARLWPITPPSGLGQTVANLCGTCHHSTGTYAGSFAPAAPASNNYVYGIQSHGHANQMVVADAPAGSTVGASGFPYVSGTDMECTSCHNVHADPSDTDGTDGGEFRPFLRDELENLCLRCHGSRQVGFATPTVFGAWDTAQIRLTNPGLHPLGTNITGDVTNVGNSPIVWGANVNVTESTVADQWSMGGHRSGTAVSCATCHAVHGRHWDPEAGAAPAGFTDNVPAVDMIAVNQGTGWNSNVNDGDESFNYLCEACHVGNETTYASAAFNWNPGGTPYAHPVDDKGATGTGNFSSSFPANWPNGGTITTWIGGTNATSPVPICESCHSPHADVNAGRADLDATAGPFILRATAPLCDGCHNGTATIAQHHPVVRTDTGSSVNGVAGVSAYLTTNTTLGCGTCHEAGTMDNTIHNWAADGRPSNLPMRTGWRPANNGRTDATYPIFGNGTGADYLPSTTCMDCHLALTSSINVSTRTATDNEFQIHGTGSHFVGTSLRSWFGAKTMPYGGASFNVTTQNWSVATSAPFTGAAARSVFGEGDGSTTYNVVCESCHNLDPDKNVAGSALLLGSYQDGFANENAQLCEGCHGTPGGTHPQTGDTVATGGNHSLITTGSNFIAPGAGTGPTVGTNQVSCDSCHQPHSAATAGVALILDTASANVGAPAQAAINVTLPGVTANPVSQRRYNAASPANLPTFNAFCSQCHPF